MAVWANIITSDVAIVWLSRTDVLLHPSKGSIHANYVSAIILLLSSGQMFCLSVSVSVSLFLFLSPVSLRQHLSNVRQLSWKYTEPPPGLDTVQNPLWFVSRTPGCVRLQWCCPKLWLFFLNNVTKLQYNIEPVGGSNETPSLSGEGSVKSQRNESMSQG